MPKITVTQKNYDGQGNNRIFTRWVKRGQSEITVQRISQAYNLDHTDIIVSES